jgi:hypothetical protein|tara:strand:- start:14726 stop:15361 length:636 start_codon:yes stop_codon:yes gene_type:complete
MSYNRNKYKIILFKNGKRVKCFFSSNSYKSILRKYSNIINEKKPKFIIEYLSRKKTRFEVGVVTTESVDDSIFVKDEFGRTKEVTMGDTTYSIVKLLPYWREELIYDHTSKTKITYLDFLSTYLNYKDFKQVFTLNNKLVVQNDEEFNLFSLKTVSDALRLIDIIEFELMDAGRMDCLFVRDTNTVQRKQLYDLLERKGYDRGFLRKQYTY